MKVFVTGVNGQLGRDVMNELYKRGYDGIGSGKAETYIGINDGTPVASMPYFQIDITDRGAVTFAIDSICPDVVIHCAAWTNVDGAEDNIEACQDVNVNGTQYVAEACRFKGAKMLYISTDYIFDGHGDEPWKPDCKEYRPLNVYGQSKLDGERAVVNTLTKYYIVRISWAFGLNGNNFIKTMLTLGKDHQTLRVVNDQIGTPTYTYDLARLLVDMIETDKYGYYHAANEGNCISWCGFAKEIFLQAGMKTQVIPITTEEYGISKADRPFNSRMDKSRLKEYGFCPLPEWQDALRRYLHDLRMFEEGI